MALRPIVERDDKKPGRMTRSGRPTFGYARDEERRGDISTGGLVAGTIPGRAQPAQAGTQFPNSPSFGQDIQPPALLSDEWRKQMQPLWPRPQAGQGQQTEDEGSLTLADYLRQAMDMIGQGGGGGGVNYDPQRSTLRQNAAEGDARLEAMYRQLRGSIDADAPVLEQAYQEAIDNTASNSATAQKQTQAATDAANSRNNEVLANLGIQEAQRNQIQEGRDLNTQTAKQIGAQATKGQAAGDLLSSNQASALRHNTNIGNAAGLEGNLQRAANQARLQALLAEIDMQEQSQNAGARQNQFGQQLSLAQQLLDFDRYEQERETSLQQSAAEMANQRYMAELEAQGSGYDPNAIIQWLQQQQVQLPEDPYERARSLDLYRKFYTG